MGGHEFGVIHKKTTATYCYNIASYIQIMFIPSYLVIIIMLKYLAWTVFFIVIIIYLFWLMTVVRTRQSRYEYLRKTESVCIARRRGDGIYTNRLMRASVQGFLSVKIFFLFRLVGDRYRPKYILLYIRIYVYTANVLCIAVYHTHIYICIYIIVVIIILITAAVGMSNYNL